ncbi:MAG: hypothetical protein GY803_32600 [Chloroflexi bacterium]|nr:hypothetical protein [Chloroflexota bacterium]
MKTIKVKRSIELISELLELADETVWLVLEGDLSQFSSQGLTGVERTIRENTTYALSRPNNRVAIPLNPANVMTIRLNVLPRVGIRAQINHVFLEQNGRALFAAYDHFKNGAQVSAWVPADFLERLTLEGVIEMEIETKTETEIEEEPISVSVFRRNYEPVYNVSQPHGSYSY